jgi:MFS family permease
MRDATTPILAPGERSSFPLLGRLALMMFLQYFIQGAFLPVATLYVKESLGFSSVAVGVFSSALTVGPILAPFLIGQLVDRLFATQYVLAACHLAAALTMLALFLVTFFAQGGEWPAMVPIPSTQTVVWLIIVLATVYSVLYVPTMMLTNAVAFEHLRQSNTEFPWVRIFGTLGFIVPAYVVEFWWLQGLAGDALGRARGIVFALSGLAGVAMAFYCLTLPHTPPKPRDDRRYAPGAVIAMLARRDFAVLMGVSFFIAMAHQFALTWFGPFLRHILDEAELGAYEQRISSLGQICELVVLAVLGLLLRRLGFKWTLVLGATAYLLRCLLFASVFGLGAFGLDPPVAGKLALAAAGQTLHGFCFGCFLAVGFMYVDRIAATDLRGSVQTIYGAFVLALGFFAGGLFSGLVGKWFSTTIGKEEVYDWTPLWLTCAALCALCVAAMIALFPKGGELRREQ